MKLTLLAVGTALALVAAKCNDAQTDELGTTLQMRALGVGLAQRHAAGSEHPAALAEVCGPGLGCAGFPLGARTTDSWERPIRYSATGGSFQLRSAGRDGRFGTGDDLTWSPEEERSRRTALAGCYSLPRSGWTAGGLIHLDTVRRGSTGYRVGPDPAWRHAEWYPMTDSSGFLIRLDNPHYNTVFEFWRSAEGLVGSARSRVGARVAVPRVPCSAS